MTSFKPLKSIRPLEVNMLEGASKLILVVEDDEVIRGTIMEILEEEGYSSMGAQNGKEALTMLAAAKKLPGLILLDLMMPVMDGWSFRDEQKKNRFFSEIPVVVVTADGSAH